MNIINDQLTFTLKYRHKKGFVVFQVTCQSELKDLLKFIGNHGY